MWPPKEQTVIQWFKHWVSLEVVIVRGKSKCYLVPINSATYTKIFFCLMYGDEPPAQLYWSMHKVISEKILFSHHTMFGAFSIFSFLFCSIMSRHCQRYHSAMRYHHGRVTSPRKDVHGKETLPLPELDRHQHQRYSMSNMSWRSKKKSYL